MPQLARNNQAIKAARCPAGKHQGQFTIEGVSNLYLIVSGKGTKTWSVRYKRRIDGKERLRSKPLGRFPNVSLKAATVTCNELMGEVHKGGDPIPEQRTAARQSAADQENAATFGEIAHRWLVRHVDRNLKPSTADFYRICLNAFIIPEIGHSPADKISRRDIIELTEEIADEDKARMADAVGNTITAIYRWAEDRELVAVNPAYRIPKHVNGDHTRDRILTDEEIPVFWQALDDASFPLIFRLLLVTGQRLSEVAGAQVAEVDFENAGGPIWTIPKQRTKNKLPHIVPITPLADDLWRIAMASLANDTHVFPTGRGGSKTPHIRRDSVTNAMAKLRARHSFDDLTTHDLRRTAYTKMGRLRIRPDVKSRCFNHIDAARSSKVDKKYDKWEYVDEKREALTAWENELQRLVNNG